jgi:ribosome-associated protein
MELKFLNRVKEIFEENKDNSLASALSSTWIAASMKGTELKLYQTKQTSQFADYILLATVQNPIQAGAMSYQMIKTLKQCGLTLRALEGNRESDWILIDMYDLVIHLFTPAAREIYALDELLASYKTVSIPQEYYTAASDQNWESLADESTEDFKNYL